jgi:hypothetical protein
VQPQESIPLFLKARHYPPAKAVEMLRPVISMLRHIEPHGIEAHEASLALSSLVEGLTAETDMLEPLWDIAFVRLGAFEHSLPASGL